MILYLPPGPVFRENSNNQHNENQYELDAYNHNAFYTQHSLATTTSSTIVTVHYRLGTFKSPIADGEAKTGTSTDSVKSSSESDPLIQYKYPLPIHDTLAVLDWVQETFQPSQTSVLGTHIGGSLALMLALTESNSLHAVAVLEPVCDWTGLDEYCAISEEEQRKYQQQDEYADAGLDSDMTLGSGPNSDPELHGVIPGLYRRTRRGRKTPSIAPPDLIPLLEARQSLFYIAQQYFDPFASPMLFVRSPATGIPSKFPQYLTGSEYPVPVLQSKLHPEEMPLDLWDAIDMQDEGELQGADDGWRGMSDGISLPTLHIPLFRRKILRWPPFGLDYGLSSATWIHPNRRLKRLEMTLPYVHIFFRDPNTTTNKASKKPKQKPHKKRKQAPETILAHQANDMAQALRRACFFGREKGFAEAGVLISRIAGEHWPAYAEEEAGWWLDIIRGEQR